MSDADHKLADLSLQPFSVPAIISYLNMLIFILSGMGVFLIIFNHVEISAVLAGVLGTVLGASGTGVATTNGFWLGNTSSSKQAQVDTAAAAKAGQAALAQIAGAGPPPPAPPLDPASPPEEGSKP